MFSKPSSILVGLAGHRAGWPWAESMSRSSVDRCRSAGFYQRVDNLEPEKTKIAPPAIFGWGKKKKKSIFFFLFFPTAAVRGKFRLFFESDMFEKKTFGLRVSTGIGLTYPALDRADYTPARPSNFTAGHARSENRSALK